MGLENYNPALLSASPLFSDPIRHKWTPTVTEQATLTRVPLVPGCLYYLWTVTSETKSQNSPLLIYTVYTEFCLSDEKVIHTNVIFRNLYSSHSGPVHKVPPFSTDTNQTSTSFISPVGDPTQEARSLGCCPGFLMYSHCNMLWVLSRYSTTELNLLSSIISGDLSWVGWHVIMTTVHFELENLSVQPTVIQTCDTAPSFRWSYGPPNIYGQKHELK